MERLGLGRAGRHRLIARLSAPVSRYDRPGARTHHGSFPSKGPGRRGKDPEISELQTELERTGKALKELAIENTLLRGSEWGLIGPIRGRRLPAEIKLQIVRATDAAKAAGMSLQRACAVIMLDPEIGRAHV